MSHSSKFFIGGVTLLLITNSGCAGNGLRNMFSRNGSEGYKTLEELEAEETKAAEKNSAVADADSDGPRFAPWLPFGKKSAAEADAIASADAAASDSEAEAPASAWWKNPFRKHDAPELDPFLARDDSQSTVVAQIDESVEDSTFPVAADTKTEFSPTADSVKTVGHRRDTKVLPGEDEMLVEKFEKHFQQNTIETAETTEQAEPLIVVGKMTGEGNPKSESTGADKLLELERLLSDRRSSAKKRNADESTFLEESPEVATVTGEIFKTSNGLKSAAHQQAETARNHVNGAVDSFDSFMAAAHSPVVSPKRPLTSDNHDGVEREGALSSTDVAVADADLLFGSAVTGSALKDTAANSGKTATGGWSGTPDDVGFQWMQAENAGLKNGFDRDGRAPKSATEKFAPNFAAARVGEKVPTASLPDTPDIDFQFSADSGAQAAGRTAIPVENAMHQVSANRELPTTATPNGQLENLFFTNTPSASASNGLAVSAPPNAESMANQDSSAGRGSLTAIKGRHWLLLLGGIIVVVLLFAPIRKKPLQANHSPIGG